MTEEENETPVLTAADILGADDLPIKELDVKEWGGKIFVQTLGGTEIAAWQMAVKERSEDGVQSAEDVMFVFSSLIVKTVVNEEGGRLFKDDHAERLAAKNPNVLRRVYEVAARMNGVSVDGEETDAAKN